VTPDQTSLVRASWPLIAARAGALTANFYTSLFEIDDSAARLFATVDMAAQRAKLVHSLAVIVDAVDNPDRLLPVVAALGRRHATYGIEQRHFDSVGHALLRALSITLGDAFTIEMHHAWGEAYELISAVMRRALVRANEPAAGPSPTHASTT
jgi:hemoglobin-like flavoprotein